MESGSESSLSADWDDVDAAVGVAVGAAEAAVTGARTNGPDERVYYLRTVADEPGILVVSRSPEPAGAAGSAPSNITLRTSIGRFGNPDRERRLLEAVARRLTDLRGRQYSPLD